MSHLETLIAAWKESMWEYSLVFEGLSDEDVWRRGHPALLSVGELTAHCAYWEANLLAQPDLNQPIECKLAVPGVKYYTTNVESPVDLKLSAAETLSELQKAHDAAVAAVIKLQPPQDMPVAGREGFKWGNILTYRSFHLAYHCGQAYSVRHMLGHSTTDN